MPLKNAIDHRDPFFLNFFFRSILIGAAEQGGAHWAFDKWCHLMCAWDSTEAAIALCTVVDYWYLAQKSSLSGFEILLKWAKRTSLEEIKRVISSLDEGSGGQCVLSSSTDAWCYSKACVRNDGAAAIGKRPLSPRPRWSLLYTESSCCWFW